MIANEYGKRITLTTGFDLSSNTNLQIELTKPDGTVVVYDTSDGVSLGSVDATVTDERGVTYTLRANQYIYRDWEDGDIDVPGKYRVRAVYIDSTKELRSRQVVFPVRP